MVHIAGAEVAVAGFLVALFARESKAFVIASGALVDIAFAVGQVLQVLDGKASVVGDPAGAAEVVGVVEVDVGLVVVDALCVGNRMLKLAVVGDQLGLQTFRNLIHIDFQFVVGR